MTNKQVELKCPWLMTEEAPAELKTWLVNVGATVEIEQDLLVLLINGAEILVPAPVDGRIISIEAESGDIIEADQVLAVLEII